MITYRPEIDGLRTVAVVPVILFHANIPLFSGGFVGVDVFFVISGYLICSIILNDLETNKFSLAGFYNRRMRRILPALFTVIFVSFLFAYWLMVPYQMENFARSAVAALAFVSNIFFFFEDNYFAESEVYKPLLHTWSLAVEEQFYLLFPIFMIAFWRIGPRFLILLIVPVSVLSILLTQWGGNLNFRSPYIEEDLLFFSQPVWASFYLPTGRVWELGVGAITAIFLRKKSMPLNAVTEIAGLSGLLLLVYSFSVVDPTTPWPSFHTLLPIAATTLIILFVRENTISGKLLSFRIIVSIGLMSYSLYLWHQPIFAFLRLKTSEEPSVSLLVFAILLCFILAFLSWRYIEKPFRETRKIPTKQAVTYLSIGCICLGYSATTAIQTKGFIDRVPPHNLDLVNVSPFERGKYVSHNFWYMRNLHFPEKTGKKISIIGDSFAQDFVNVIQESNYLQNQNVVTFSLPLRCFSYLKDSNIIRNEITSNFKNCRDEYLLGQGIELIRDSDVVIFAFAWNAEQIRAIKEVKSELQSKLQQQFIFTSSKSFGQINVNSLTELSLAERLRYRQQISLSNTPDILAQAGKDNFIDLQRLICIEDYHCPLFTPEGLLISYDGMHLTKAGAKFLGPQIFSHPLLLSLIDRSAS